MTETEVTAKDRERYAQARARGQARAQDPSAVVDASYDPKGDVIDLKFGGGGSMAIRSKAKAAAAKANGVKGGRPRKRLSAEQPGLAVGDSPRRNRHPVGGAILAAAHAISSLLKSARETFLADPRRYVAPFDQRTADFGDCVDSVT